MVNRSHPHIHLHPTFRPGSEIHGWRCAPLAYFCCLGGPGFQEERRLSAPCAGGLHQRAGLSLTFFHTAHATLEGGSMVVFGEIGNPLGQSDSAALEGVEQ